MDPGNLDTGNLNATPGTALSFTYNPVCAVYLIIKSLMFTVVRTISSEYNVKSSKVVLLAAQNCRKHSEAKTECPRIFDTRNYNTKPHIVQSFPYSPLYK
eukprot:4426486-Pleurochrysis_carterae.AAC.1